MHHKIHHQNLNNSILNVCVYCIYVQNTGIPAYIIDNIKAIGQCGYDTVIVSHSSLKENDVTALKPYCAAIVEKENIGYDFFAWKFGMDLCQHIPVLENVLLINDSVIGPFFPLNTIFEKMNDRYDFWGLTENEEFKYHLQSYFLHANKKARETIGWKEFWSDMQIFENKLDIVKNYEVELTQVLLAEPGIKIGAWVKTAELELYKQDRKYIDFPNAEFWTGKSNPTIRFWKELIRDHQYPYIKKNLFFDKEHYHVVTNGVVHVYNVFPVGWKNLLKGMLEGKSVALIEDFLDRHYSDKYGEAKMITDRYRSLMICKNIESSEQMDFLIRMLRFFISINISVELIIQETSTDLSSYHIALLQDLGRLTILNQMSRNEIERHRCIISQDKIALLFIVEEYSCDLAASYLYTGAQPVLLSTKGTQPQEIQNIEKAVNRFSCPVISPVMKLKQTLPGKEIYLFDPISALLQANNQPYKAKANSNDLFKIGIHGIKNLSTHQKSVIRVINELLEKGKDYRVYLFLNEAEEPYCKKLLSDKYAEFRKLIETGRMHLVFDKETEIGMVREAELSLGIVYETELVMSQIICEEMKSGIPILYTDEKGTLDELLGEAVGDFKFDYFDIKNLVSRIVKLKSDKKFYSDKASLLAGKFKNYAEQINNSVLVERLITQELIDFTELRTLVPRITVIFHFHFYSFDKAAFQYYKRRLREFYNHNVDFLFSITSDSYNIPGHTQELKDLFKNCQIKIVPNKGRDIGAKFLLFDYYLQQGAQSEYLVVLHDKKSLHLPFWEARAWIESLLKIIDPAYTRQIIARFETNDNIGIIGSGERIMDCILRWEQKGAVPKPIFEWNNDLLHELISQLQLDINDYKFVGGTMFWIKSSVLEKINLRYNFMDKYEELEEGNVMDNNGSTITHSWERLLCWSSTDLGYNVIGI